jgi:predicted transcriptional regulator
VNSEIAETTSKRRDKLHIIAQILEIAKNGTMKTQIMYKANLSFAQLGGYLTLMLKIDLLVKLSYNGKDMYKTTAKGIDFLQRHREIAEMLKTENENNSKGPRIPPYTPFRNQ